MTEAVSSSPSRSPLLFEGSEAPLSFTKGLGIVGWSRLDPVLLAAIAYEKPVLLVGEHGTAKTHLVRKIAERLGLKVQIYDASQVQLDDVVGVFYPDDNGERLRFIATDASIWDAEIVLIDELSRARPDMANRLFTLILDRRVLGHPLPKLRLVFAAMNPPPADDEEEEGYIGTVPLDPALADRFPYVVRVPHWREFGESEIRGLVEGGGHPSPEDASIDLRRLVDLARERAEAIGPGIRRFFGEYVCAVSAELDRAGIRISGRRVVMLRDALLHLHAARSALAGIPIEDVDLEGTARLALDCTLPQNAEARTPQLTKVEAAHRKVYDILLFTPEDVRARIASTRDPVRKVLLADEAREEKALLSRVVTSCVQEITDPVRRRALAVVLYLRYRDSDRLDPATKELLLGQTRDVFSPRVVPRHRILKDLRTKGGNSDEKVRKAAWFVRRGMVEGTLLPIEEAFLLADFERTAKDGDVREALAYLRETAERLGVDLASAVETEHRLGPWASQVERQVQIKE